jgi:hypothetical protein
VLDESRTSESRALVAAIENTGNFKLRREPATSRAEVERAIVSGKVRAAVIIPPTFARDLKRGAGAEAQATSPRHSSTIPARRAFILKRPRSAPGAD